MAADEAVSCSTAVLEGIAAHARAEAPRECCGLLVGEGSRIDSAHPLPNRAPDPLRRYEIDPRDFLALVKRCRGTPASVIGAYHSHPRAAAEPSATDRAEGVEGFLYLIAGPVAGELPPPIRAYRCDGGNFREVWLVPDPKESET